MDIFKLHLNMLELEVRDRPIERVLDSLSNGILEASRSLDRTAETGDESYLDAVIDEETDIIENLLGAAFVVGQTYLTGVVSAVMRINEGCRKRLGVPLLTAAGSRPGILAVGKPVAGTCYTMAQAIEAFANYFKHRDEWRQMDWTRLEKPQQILTAKVIMAFGAESGSTGNLRSGSAALGNASYTDLDVLSQALKEWGSEVLTQVRRDLSAIPKSKPA